MRTRIPFAFAAAVLAAGCTSGDGAASHGDAGMGVDSSDAAETADVRGAHDATDTSGAATTACAPDSTAAPHPPGIPYVGVHANPQNNDRVDCATAGAWDIAWHALQGRAIAQPNTFSPDGQTTWVTTSAPDDGCTIHALDVATGTVRWCLAEPDAIVGSVAVDAAGHLYVGAGGDVFSLTADGDERWRTTFTLPDGAPGGPTGIHLHPLGYVALAAGTGEIALLDPQTGAVAARLDVYDAFDLPRVERPGLGLDLTALLPEAVVDDFTAVFGGIDPLLAVFVGVGAQWTDNTIGIAPDGTLYAIGSGPDADTGALVQVRVTDDDGGVTLTPGWIATFRGGSASSPSISPDGRHLKITDGNSTAGLLTPSTVDARALIYDLEACDADTDDDNPTVCTAALVVPLRSGPALGASPILDDLEHYAWEVQFAGLFDHAVPDLVRYVGDTSIWALDLPDGGVWSSVLTLSDTHVIGTATWFTPSDETLLTIDLPGTATSEVVAVDRSTGELVFRAPITDDSTSTVTVGPDGALFVTQLGLLSGFAVDTTITGGLMRFAPARPDAER